MKQPAFDIKKMNQRGFGIIQVLVSVALVGIMSLAIASMMNSANKANRNITMTLEAASTTALLGMLLSDRNFCEVNFTVNNVVDIDLGKLADLKIPVRLLAYPPANPGGPSPEVIFDRANPKPQGNSIKIEDMFLSDIKSFNAGLQVAKLNIVYDKGPGTQGPAIVTRNLYLRLETVVTAGNVVRVIHCNSIGFGDIPQAPGPTGGGQVPLDEQEIDDKLFQNLLAGAKKVAPWDRAKFIADMITNWQNAGFVSKGRYMTVAKFNALVVAAEIAGNVKVRRYNSDTRKWEETDLCKFFGGKFIDKDKAPLVTGVITFGNDKLRCANNFAK